LCEVQQVLHQVPSLALAAAHPPPHPLQPLSAKGAAAGNARPQMVGAGRLGLAVARAWLVPPESRPCCALPMTAGPT
jgi:hypothetical protein